MTILIWGAVALAALVTEYLTRVRVAICFLPSSIAAALAFCFSGKFWLEILLFLAVSSVFLLIRLFMRAKRPTADEGIEVDRIVGSHCRVIEPIDNVAGSGQARCRGCDWAARALDDDETFSVGDIVSVVAVEGVRLVCKKI